MDKCFKLSKDQLKPLVEGYGACIASDMITVEGLPVLFMYREEPINEVDGGWRYMSGYESDEFMDRAENHGFHDVNTIANYDPSIIPFLDMPVGSVFEKGENSDHFVEVTDW